MKKNLSLKTLLLRKATICPLMSWAQIVVECTNGRWLCRHWAAITVLVVSTSLNMLKGGDHSKNWASMHKKGSAGTS